MNCAQARFLLYAYLDRDVSGLEADLLSRHLAECGGCSERARSARGLARVLRSRVERAPAPSRLRRRLHQGDVQARFRYPLAATAAVVLLLMVPLVADVSTRPSALSAADPADGTTPPGMRMRMGASRSLPVAATMSSLPGGRTAAPVPAGMELVSRQMTGVLVCLECESRLEAGLCPLPESHHEAAFCADNGEVWRLMPRDPGFTQRSAGQTLTVEGVGFPQSGFLRASRVGY